MIIVFNSSGPGGIWGGLAIFLITACLSGELPLLTLDFLGSLVPILLVIGVAAWLFTALTGGQRQQQNQPQQHHNHQQHQYQQPFHSFNGPFGGIPSPPWFGAGPSWFPFSGGPFPNFQHLFHQQWPGFPSAFGPWFQAPHMGARAAQAGRAQQQQQQNRPRRYTLEEVATALHKLPVETFGGVQQGAETSTDHLSCSICCDDYCDGDAMRVLPCGHQYHIECVDRWFLSCTDYTRAPACPLCNKPLIRDGERPVEAH